MWDLIVVGAGPAGATAARVAAESGARVLLVDKDDAPRYKTCGGGIIGITRQHLPPGFPQRDDITAITLSLCCTRDHTRHARERFLSMVLRPECDEFLVRQAVQAGAEFRPHVVVRAAEQNEQSVRVLTAAGEELAARYLVDASGTSSRIARQLGVEVAEIDLGLERELVASPEQQALWAGRIHADFGAIPGSYGWLFPKGDTLTVGVIGRKGDPAALKQYLDDYQAHLGLADAPVLHDSGHLTRCRTATSPLGQGRIVLAGDAAGLLEPFTREGLSYATRSGTVAGQSIAAALIGDDPEPARAYTTALQSTLCREIEAGLVVRRCFETVPGAFWAMVARSFTGWRFFTAFAAGRTSFPDIVAKPYARIPMALIRRFAAARA